MLAALTLSSGCLGGDPVGDDGDDDGANGTTTSTPEPTSTTSMEPVNCEETEVIVAYVGTDDEHEECMAEPMACEIDDPCFDNACLGALYALCEDGTLGSACADFGGALVVSCN